MIKIISFFSETPFSKEQLTRLRKLSEFIEVPRGLQNEKVTAAYVHGADFAVMASTTVPFISRAILESGKKLKGIVINTTNFNSEVPALFDIIESSEN